MISEEKETPGIRWRSTLSWFDARRRGLGMWAFVLHRLTGILLVVYLFLHFVVFSTLALGPAAYDSLIPIMKSPFLFFFDVGLFLALLYHGLNGLRVTLVGLGMGVQHQKAIFWGLMGLVVIILTYGTYRLFLVF